MDRFSARRRPKRQKHLRRPRSDGEAQATSLLGRLFRSLKAGQESEDLADARREMRRGRNQIEDLSVHPISHAANIRLRFAQPFSRPITTRPQQNQPHDLGLSTVKTGILFLRKHMGGA